MSSLAGRGWLLACAISGLALGVGAVGCGGSSPSLGGHGDGGGDAASEGAVVENEGGDATMASDAGASDDSPTSSGDDSGETGVPGTDGGDSATATDTSTDSPVVATESGSDASGSGAPDGSDGAAASCGANNSACSNAGANGLCEAMVCSSCTDTTDDANCSSAYGDGGSSGYLCLAGVCSPGNCRTDADCTGASAAGPLCGVTTANMCGKCTTDSECSGNAAGAFCNTTTGGCVAGTCTGTGANPPTACPFNAGDICCTTVCQAGAPTGATSCCPGTAGDTYCAAQIGASATCASGTCTKCAAGASNAFTVDPVNGSDTAGNGNIAGGNPATCAFKTITRALEVIGNDAAFAITVTVIGPSTVATGETFPIPVPQNVTLTTSGGAVTVNVPQAKVGFVLNAPNASIAGGAGAALTVSGQANKGTFGITASSATSTGTSISNLTVSSFATAGILVQNGGTLGIGAGVTSTGSPDGLHLMGTGTPSVTINVPSGAAATHFDSNTVHGILVSGNGSISLTGAVASTAVPPMGTVTTNHNTAAGVWVEQTAGTPPLNTITGLVSYANTGNGLRLVGGSNVKVRGSVSLGNTDSGVIVSAGAAGGGAATNDISKIDLGDPSDAGGTIGNNTLQAALGDGQNGNAGVCLAMRANAGTLLAAGNAFSTLNCATATGGVVTNAAGCGNTCAGGVCDIGFSGAGNSINVSLCSHP